MCFALIWQFSTATYYRIAGNFNGGKFWRFWRFPARPSKFNPSNFEGNTVFGKRHWPSVKIFSVKYLKSQHPSKFPLSKFPAIRYLVLCTYQCHPPPTLPCGLTYFYRGFDREYRPNPGDIDISFQQPIIALQFNLCITLYTGFPEVSGKNIESKHSVRLIVICMYQMAPLP